MASPKTIPLAALGFVLTGTTAFGIMNTALYNEIYTLDAVIPDNDPAGFSDTQAISADEIASIESVQVTLTFTDGWMGDLYASLSHESGFSVLLNRIGRPSSSTLGSSAGLMDATFMTGAPDIHLATAPLTGAYSPDARETDPAFTLDTDARTADFSSFLGMPASGDWTLFIADVGPGEFATLESWELTLTGVPEPASTVALLGLGAGLIALFRTRGTKQK